MPILKDLEGIKCKSRFQVAQHNKRILAERKGAAPKPKATPKPLTPVVPAAKAESKPKVKPAVKVRQKPAAPKPAKAAFKFGTGESKQYYCMTCNRAVRPRVPECPYCGTALNWSKVLESTVGEKPAAAGSESIGGIG